MHFRRNNRRVELDPSRELLFVQPARGPMLVIAGILLAAGGAAAAGAASMSYHNEPWWGLAIVWALVAVIFGVLALLPGFRLQIELARDLLNLDGATHSLDAATFSYELVDQYAGRRRIQYWVVRLAIAGRTLKLLELSAGEEDTAHNLVAGLQQVQNGQRKEGIETLTECIECAPPAMNREILMVVALILAPLFVFWLKGAFH